MNFKDILFIDIETVAQYSDYNQVPDDWKALWDIKAQREIKNPEKDSAETVYERAGIYAEFGKIVCISCGCIQGSGDNKKLIVKSFYGQDETKLLKDFVEMLNKWTATEKKSPFDKSSRSLCAHNGKEFDFPYLCRRMIINNIHLPECLNIRGKKPWEISHIDTMDLWKFGDSKNFTSLKLLAQALGIPSPKDDIDGSMVNHVYWIENDLERIVKYCQKDVITLANIYLRMYCEPLIHTENIEYKSWHSEAHMHPVVNGKLL